LLCALDERATITRLGEGVDKTRTLKPAAIARTRACLEEYARLCKGAEKIAVVGTSAMRDAGGGEEIRAAVKELFGVEARTISGDEEARLTFIGGTSGLSIANEACVYDIGGGSTEIVIGRGTEIAFAHSFDIGSVRLTERHVRNDPPTQSELDAIMQSAREILTPLEQLILKDADLVGIAGTVTTLAAVSLTMVPYDGARVHGLSMTRSEIEDVVLRLAKLPNEERSKVPGLEPKRADVIVAGGLIALAVMDALGREKTRVSDRGVRWGLAEEICP
jgi:exopolyphosphatase/guanosine-5'-triphosphate,3'-diphosphate pyrophosphatase